MKRIELNKIQVDPENANQQVVYFVRGGDRGRIKIGVTKDLQARIKNLQAASPIMLKVVGVMDMQIVPFFPLGEKSIWGLEKYLHRLFAEYRHHGEWFDPSTLLSAVISRYASKSSVAITAGDHRSMARILKIECAIRATDAASDWRKHLFEEVRFQVPRPDCFHFFSSDMDNDMYYYPEFNLPD